MRTRLWAAAFAALALAGSAQAQAITMRFGRNGLPSAAPGSLILTGTPGGTVTFQVFLTDTDIQMRPPAQGGTLNGVGPGTGVGVLSGNTALGNFQSTADLTQNPEFNFNNANGLGVGTVNANGIVTGGSPPFPAAVINDSNLLQTTQLHQQVPSPGVPTTATPDYILVGTFTLHIPAGTPGGTTQLSLFDPHGGTFVDNQSGSNANLDGLPGMFADTASMVVPVPEPASFALVGLAAAGFATRRRKAVAVA